MKKYFFFVLCMAAFSSPAFAQQTTVTATVTDPSSHPYSFLTGYASLVCPGNQAPTYNGYSMPRTFAITGGDGNGTFTQVLYDVNVIAPSGCGYQWHITWKDGITSFITGSITTVTGTSVNESAAISAFSVPLPPPPTGILLETNGTTNTVQSTLNLLNGTGISLTADGAGGVTVTNVNPVNLSASSPIVVSPNPITSTGTVSCPTCNTSSATIAGTITSTHIPYASAANTLSDIAGSAVTGATGAIALTAGADTTDPVTINSHSGTQSADILDINHQSAGGGGTGTLAAPLVVEGAGYGAYDPGNNKAQVAINAASHALSGVQLVITNTEANSSSNRTSTLEFSMPDNGISQIAGGNAVGDSSGNYPAITFDGNPSIYGATSAPGGMGISLIDNPNSALQVPVTIGNLNASTTANMLDVVNSTQKLSGILSNGCVYFVVNSVT